IAVFNLRNVAVGPVVAAALVWRRRHIVVVLGLVVIADLVAVAVLCLVDQPWEDSIGILRIEDPRALGPAIEVDDIVVRVDPPVRIVAAEALPALDARERAFVAGAIGNHVPGWIAVRLAPAVGNPCAASL